MKRWVLLMMTLWVLGDLYGQSIAFGIKGGPTLGVQRWQGSTTNDPLIKYHGAVWIETDSEESTGSLFAEAGYHIKGRAQRFRAGVNPFTGNTFDARTFQMRFQNASLSLGGRQRFLTRTNLNAYYSLALRVEYTIAHELEIYEGLSAGVNNFVYGVTLGGGFEFPFGELVSGVLDIRLSPDISRQIFVPPFEWNNPWTGRVETFREQNIRNIALEVSVGFRFLNKVILVDY
ncbi:MAG: hypothetical protein KTR24_07610 [Saprospiraceae bacterium]|nr:hypothetical protein [Saprospiraceae bacterium]